MASVAESPVRKVLRWHISSWITHARISHKENSAHTLQLKEEWLGIVFRKPVESCCKHAAPYY